MADNEIFDKPEKTQVEKIKPRFSMDLMIFGNLNELNKMIDQSAFDAKRGDHNSLFGWVSALDQLYINMASFIKEDVEKINYIESAFTFLRQKINYYTQTLPSTIDEMNKVMTVLRDLNKALYEVRNETFIKIKKQMATIDKIMEYDFGLLPKDQQIAMRKRLEAEENG
jgi:hypothetical protein